MEILRRNNPHLRLTAAIIVAVLAALAGSVASDGADSRSRKLDREAAFRLVVADDATCTNLAERADGFVHAVTCHAEQAALVASDRSDTRAERTLRRLAAHDRAALLKTTALPPPIA